MSMTWRVRFAALLIFGAAGPEAITATTDAWTSDRKIAQAQNPTVGPAPPGPHCEWLPREEQLPAGGQCGFNDLSAPNPGIFDCGVRAESGRCVRYCVFKRCAGP
jgi:hypothetical protein